jgi:hypothetical protein
VHPNAATLSRGRPTRPSLSLNMRARSTARRKCHGLAASLGAGPSNPPWPRPALTRETRRRAVGVVICPRAVERLSKATGRTPSKAVERLPERISSARGCTTPAMLVGRFFFHQNGHASAQRGTCFASKWSRLPFKWVGVWSLQYDGSGCGGVVCWYWHNMYNIVYPVGFAKYSPLTRTRNIAT